MKKVLATGRFSLNVGVRRPFSTENSSGWSLMALALCVWSVKFTKMNRYIRERGRERKERGRGKTERVMYLFK